MERHDLNNRFAYHKPSSDTIAETHENIRDLMLTTAYELNECLPECREKSTAIARLEEAMFWANAAVARHQ